MVQIRQFKQKQILNKINFVNESLQSLRSIAKTGRHTDKPKITQCLTATCFIYIFVNMRLYVEREKGVERRIRKKINKTSDSEKLYAKKILNMFVKPRNYFGKCLKKCLFINLNK